MLPSVPLSQKHSKLGHPAVWETAEVIRTHRRPWRGSQCRREPRPPPRWAGGFAAAGHSLAQALSGGLCQAPCSSPHLSQPWATVLIPLTFFMAPDCLAKQGFPLGVLPTLTPPASYPLPVPRSGCGHLTFPFTFQVRSNVTSSGKPSWPLPLPPCSLLGAPTASGNLFKLASVLCPCDCVSPMTTLCRLGFCEDRA